MTYQALRFIHPNKILICCPDIRNYSRRVVSWTCLRVVDSIEAAREALERLELEGRRELVAISTNEELVIEGDLAARYFRVFFGMQ